MVFSFFLSLLYLFPNLPKVWDFLIFMLLDHELMTVHHSYIILQHTEALTKSQSWDELLRFFVAGVFPPYFNFFLYSFFRIKEAEISLWSWAGEIKIKEFKPDEMHFSIFQWYNWPLTLRLYQGREMHFPLLSFE